jgi:glycine/D-amino acid oxidase-like deaminating enzyme
VAVLSFTSLENSELLPKLDTKVDTTDKIVRPIGIIEAIQEEKIRMAIEEVISEILEIPLGSVKKRNSINQNIKFQKSPTIIGLFIFINIHKMEVKEPKTIKNYTIIGQGLAGSILAYFLLKEGQNVQIFDNPSIPSSSKIAAGIYNPVTGKRLVKTWLADEIFPFLEDFYPQLEEELNAKFFFPMPLFHPFPDIATQKFFKSDHISDDFFDYCSLTFENLDRKGTVNSTLGGITMKHAGWVDLKVMLNAFRDYFIERNILTTAPHDGGAFSSIITAKKSDEKVPPSGAGRPTLRRQTLRGSVTIFCEGYNGKFNPHFSYLPFNPVKGEILDIEIQDLDLQEIINQGVFVIPLKNNKYRLGATYKWDVLDDISTEEARELLTEKYQKLMKPPMRILSQLAGVRPATKDRRPFIGIHPELKNIGIFNGFGSKGVSLAPFFGKQFVDFLIHKKELHPEVNINRFASLYLGY